MKPYSRPNSKPQNSKPCSQVPLAHGKYVSDGRGGVVPISAEVTGAQKTCEVIYRIYRASNGLHRETCIYVP